MDSPFEITIYSKTFARTGWVSDPLEVSVTTRHNAIGSAAVTVAADHRRLPDLAADGARLVIKYNGEHLISGPVRGVSGEGPRSSGTVTFSIEDDIRLLWRVLGWPIPANAIDSQGLKEDTATGAAETVAKGFISRNVSRLSLPVTVAASLGRGATITVGVRMVPLADKLLPAIDVAGIGLTVQQSGSGLLVDAYAPQVYPRALTEAGGTVVGWSWSKAGPTATRTVVGGVGVGDSRMFRTTVDATREALFGDVLEVFTDGGDENVAAKLVAAGHLTLDEAGPKSGLSVELAESDNFRYGGLGVHRGDQVSIEVGAGVVITDVLREATVSWTRDAGLNVSPTVGDRSDDPDVSLAQRLSMLARGLRNLRTR
jgi:hypothetical protein